MGITRKQLFDPLDDVITDMHAVLSVFERTSEWKVQPEGQWGAGEVIMHLDQACRVATRVLEAACNGSEVKLPKAYQELPSMPPAERRIALDRLNFEAARRQFVDFRDGLPSMLAGRVLACHADARRRLYCVRTRNYDTKTRQPLTGLEGPWSRVFGRLLVEHPTYHLGQVVQMLKASGVEDLPPLGGGFRD